MVFILVLALYPVAELDRQSGFVNQVHEPVNVALGTSYVRGSGVVVHRKPSFGLDFHPASCVPDCVVYTFEVGHHVVHSLFTDEFDGHQDLCIKYST
ncbi:hypothetical protein I541_1024 [Mycobacteroides abscessus]|nr:hypothetical protein L836_2290 [Mycobacteroides abscessus MAB_110811_2726]EUA84235.1 hypothetical protein I541_1024 [Mycobacteroides abscessus]